MELTKNRSINAGAKLSACEDYCEFISDKGFKVRVVFAIGLKDVIVFDEDGNNLFSLDYSEDVVSKFWKLLTGEPLDFGKKEEWKVGNVVEDKGSVYILSQIKEHLFNAMLIKKGIYSYCTYPLYSIVCGLVINNFTKTHETLEDYYRDRFAKEGEKKEVIKPKIDHVYLLNDGRHAVVVDVLRDGVDNSDLYKCAVIGEDQHYDRLDPYRLRIDSFDEELSTSFRDYFLSKYVFWFSNE